MAAAQQHDLTRRPAHLGALAARLSSSTATVQALKTALAAGVAWALGGQVPGAPPLPYLAPLTAVLTVQLTIAESVSGAVQRTAGAVVGVIMALLVSGYIGVNAFTIAAVVLVAQLIGRLLRLPQVGSAQVVTTALLVLTVGGVTTFAYGVGRVVETLVGALVGVAINALLVPPTHVSAAVDDYRAQAEAVSNELHAIADDLKHGLSAEAATQHLGQTREGARRFAHTRQALQRAEDSLRMNVLRSEQRDELNALGVAIEALERSVVQTRTLARVLADCVATGRPVWLDPSALGVPLAELVEAVAACLHTSVHGQGAELASCKAAALDRQKEVLLRAREAAALLPAEGWLQLGSILSTLERLNADLGQSAGWEDDG